MPKTILQLANEALALSNERELPTLVSSTSQDTNRMLALIN